MKREKIFAALLTLCLLTGTGCSSQKTFTQTKKNEENKTEEREGKPQTTPEATEKASKNKLAGQVLYDRDGITITLKETELNPKNMTLPLLIENNTEETIVVQARDIAVNNVMYDAIFSADVAAGKKANDTMTLVNYDDRIKFKGISTIEFAFHIFDDASWETLDDSEQIVLTAENADYVYEPDTEGTVLYDQNGLRITWQGITEAMGQVRVLLLAENTSDTYYCIQTRDASINGFMMDPIMSTDVLPGKTAYTSMDFLKSYLDENEIAVEDIEEIEFYFHIFDTLSWENQTDSDIITINTK